MENNAGIWARIEELLVRYDGGVNLDVASECMWGGELRLTLTNPIGKPSRSIVFFSCGKCTPEEVGESLLADAMRWLKSSRTSPISPEAASINN